MLLAYCRCSTLEQAADGRSTLQDQERIVRGIAMARGEASPAVYADPGVSGAVPLHERPMGSKMLSEAEPGDYICASKLDRLFRSSIDALTTVEKLKGQGIGVILADISTEPVSDNGVGKLFFSILAAVADFERERIAERVTLGRASKKARNGHIGGDAPYGYDKSGKGASCILTPNDVEQEVILEMVKVFKENKSYNRTARELNGRSRIARKGLWYPTQVKRIMERERVVHVS
jgi:putative DNA-invertase from lambdoid prophage Rac